MNVNNRMMIMMAIGVMSALSACADDQNGTSNSPVVHQDVTQATIIQGNRYQKRNN